MTIERKPSSLLNRFMDLFKMLMAFLYLFFGAFLLFSPYIMHQEPERFRQFLGVGIMLYGIFRLFKYFQNIKIKNGNESIEE